MRVQSREWTKPGSVKRVLNQQEHGIKEFTLSGTAIHANVISTLAEFRKFGFVVKGMIDIKDFNGATIPALLVKEE